jgi:hypothetical protein
VVPRDDSAGGASNAAAHDPALAEIIGVRLLLVNVLGPVAAGEKVTPEKFNQLLDQISEAKHQIDLLPVFRTSPSMISDERKGKRVCRRAGTQKRR